jgi:CDP-diacylglycerol--glycerol-3-phosphate 3-phosphatidyltransferase
VIYWLVDQTWTGAATLAFFLCLIAAITDVLDGYIARRFGMITNFGKLFDAIVDKVMVIALFLILYDMGLLDGGIQALKPIAFFLIWMTLFRDLIITGMRMMAARRGLVLAADTMGKRKAIWQITSTCVFLLVPATIRDFPVWTGWDWSWFEHFAWYNAMLYFYMSGFLTIYSGALYVVRYLPFLLKKGRLEEPGV